MLLTPRSLSQDLASEALIVHAGGKWRTLESVGHPRPSDIYICRERQWCLVVPFSPLGQCLVHLWITGSDGLNRKDAVG